MLKQALRIGRGLRNMGFLQSVAYKMHRVRTRFLREARPYTLRSRYAKYPLYCRPRTTDVQVFSQIFVGREYRCLDDIRHAEFIVDCGANVGYSSAYFMSAYEDAHVIAIEPDPGNFDALVRNLQPFGDRVQAIRSAVWPEPVDWCSQKTRAAKDSSGPGECASPASTWVEVGRNVGSMTARTTKLLDLCGSDVFAKAVADTIDRGTHDPGEIGVLCEKQQRVCFLFLGHRSISSINS